MRCIVPGLCAICSVVALASRSGMAGEGYVSGDPLSLIWRTLLESGITGCFIAYLIWREIRDHRQKIEDNKRWHILDRELVDLVEKCTKAISESTAVLTELRSSITELWYMQSQDAHDHAYAPTEADAGETRSGKTVIMRKM